MPWFRRTPDDEKQRAETDAAMARLSIEALESGGLPANAQQRLEELRDRGDGFFTSDLSVDEFLLSRHAGVRPLSLVMGSSISRVARQAGMGWGGTGELVQLSDAINDTRSRALSRLLAEARTVGAHSVVGVRIQQRTFEWGAELMEFTAIGTAVVVDPDPLSSDEPSLSDLSGQEFWELYTGGYWPVGICAATSVYHVYSSSWGNVNLMFGGFANQELTDFSVGAYAARAAAVARIQSQAKDMDASGLVGVSIEQRQQVLQEAENAGIPIRMLFTFTAMGTAVKERGDADAVQEPEIMLDLR